MQSVLSLLPGDIPDLDAAVDKGFRLEAVGPDMNTSMI